MSKTTAAITNAPSETKWPGLPRGVKFDPSDEELLWHLLAEIGDGDAKPHPHIGEFINILDADNEFDYSFPHKLPGVRHDGSFSYFFHRPFRVHDNKTLKCRKIVNDELSTTYWHKIGKTQPIYVNGVHKGSKKIMTLYRSMADNEKPEKTSWIMQQYHVGAGEDAVGNLVVSKIFYQQKFRQGEKNAHNFCTDTVEVVSMGGESTVAPKLVAPELHARDSNLIWMDVPIQATCHEMQVEENNTDSELRRLDKSTSFPAEDSKNVISPEFLLNYQQQRNDIRSYAGFVQREPSSGHEVYIPVDNNDTKDASSSGKNDCDTANEEETSPNTSHSSHIMLETQAYAESLCPVPAANDTCEISCPTGVDFHTANMLDHASRVKVEPSDYMQGVSCKEIADNISRAVIGMPELSCEPEMDEIDNVTLQERYKSMLSNMTHIPVCHCNLEHSKNIEPCAKGFASYNRKYDEDSEILDTKERQETPVGHLDANYENISAPQESTFRSNINNIEECFNGKVKDEIKLADEQIPFGVCELHTAQHIDSRSIAHPLLKSLDHVVSGSPLAVDQSLASPSCLNNLSLEPCHSDEIQDSKSGYWSQASALEVRLPVISCKPGNVNGKSHPDSSATYAVRLKSEPVEETMVSYFCHTNYGVQRSTDILRCSVMDIDTCSLPAQCHPDRIDDSSFGRCKSQYFREGSCRYSDESSLDSVQGLLHENGKNHPSDMILHVLPLEVKAEPLEESNLKCIPENNAELSSPFTKTSLNSNKKLPGLVPSSCRIKPKLESVESCQLVPSECPPSILPEIGPERPIVKMERIDEHATDFLEHIPLSERMQMLPSITLTNLSYDRNVDNAPKTLPPVDSGSSNVYNAKTKPFSVRRKRKKTATDSVETALEEDAPGLLQVLLDKGVTVEEIKLYGDSEEEGALPICCSDDSFEELEAIISKIFSEGPSIFKFPSVRQIKGSKTVYCLACLISLIEQTRYLRFRKSPVEWGWCRDLQSFIFVFERHNRIVVERPEYGYATYFFELVESLPIVWQIKRLVTAMKLPCCSRTVLLENKPLLVGEDLTEGEARVMEEYGWTRSSGLGTLLNYCDRVVHDRNNERYSSEWGGKIAKLLMKGMDGGRTVLTNLPTKAKRFVDRRNPVLELET